MFHSLYLAKGDGKKVPQISHIRDKLNMKKVPPVYMEIGYRSKESDEIEVVRNATSIPTSKYPPCTYNRLYEIACVDVSIFFLNLPSLN